MTEPQGRDWYDWHWGDEPDSGSRLRRRLSVVQDLLGRALDACDPGRIAVASLCAGQGDDLPSVLDDHPRAGDVDPDRLSVCAYWRCGELFERRTSNQRYCRKACRSRQNKWLRAVERRRVRSQR